MAINYRQKMDIKNNLFNGYNSDDELKKDIEPISIENVKVKKNLSSTNISGKEGVYFSKKYNYWAVEFRDENNKKKRKTFYVTENRTFEEAKKLAMDAKDILEQNIPLPEEVNEGIFFCTTRNYWGVYYKEDLNDKKKCKTFSITKHRNKEEAKQLALKFKMTNY